MKKFFALLLIAISVFSLFTLTVIGEGEESAGTAAPSTDAPQGIVLDSSIVFAILIAAAALGIAGGYWFARKRK